jgi:alkylhydroperoxidase family enzyme
VLGSEIVEAVYADWRTAPLDERVRAALGIIDALAHGDVTPEAIAHARAAGLSDDDIEDAVAVCATFHIIDRLADAFDFALPDEDGTDAAVRVLLRRGYSMPAPVWRFAD